MTIDHWLTYGAGPWWVGYLYAPIPGYLDLLTWCLMMAYMCFRGCLPVSEYHVTILGQVWHGLGSIYENMTLKKFMLLQMGTELGCWHCKKWKYWWIAVWGVVRWIMMSQQSNRYDTSQPNKSVADAVWDMYICMFMYSLTGSSNSRQASIHNVPSKWVLWGSWGLVWASHWTEYLK